MKSHRTHSDELTRIEAYLLSERAGHPPGMESTFWTQAEALVSRRLSETMRKAKRARPTAAKGKAPERKTVSKVTPARIPTESVGRASAANAKQVDKVKPASKKKPLAKAAAAPSSTVGKKNAAKRRSPRSDGPDKLDV